MRSRNPDAAQIAWDNKAPDEDGPAECPECDGSGKASDDKCQICQGSGRINDDGSAFDPNEAA